MLKINRKILTFAGIVLLLIVLPIAIFLIRQAQDTRSGAAVDAGIGFNPIQDEKAINEEFDVLVIVNGGTANVSYVQMDLNYNETILEAVSFTPSGNYTNIKEPEITQQNGRIEIEVVDPSDQAPTGDIEIGVIKFKGTTAGVGDLDITGSVMYATGETGAVNVTTLSTGSYTIVDSTTANEEPTNTPTLTPTEELSPTIDVCKTNSGRPNSCNCANDFQCLSGYCDYPVPGPTGAEEVGLCQIRPTNSPSPTADVCIAPTGLWPNGCACTSDHQCLGGKCSPNGTCTVAVSPSPSLTPIPSLTDIPLPTTTLAPGETGLKVVFKLPGIGNGDGENQNPVRASRTVTATLTNSTNVAVFGNKIGTAIYNSATGNYEGLVKIGENVLSGTGSYTVKIKVDNSLNKRVPGIVTIIAGSDLNTSQETQLVTGDINGDNNLSLEDYNAMVSCYQMTAGCTSEMAILTDLNDNGTSEGDTDDFNIMQRGFAIRDGD